MALAAVLARSPVEVLSTNSIPATTIVAVTKGGASTCQGGESVPRGTSAVRLWVAGNAKPVVRVEVLSGLEPIASGEQESGWLGKVVTVPIEPIASTVRDATLCFTIDRAVEEINLYGSGSPHPAPGESRGKVRVEYLRAGPASWWSLAGAVRRTLSLGRAPEGSYAFLIPLLAMTLAALLACWTIFRYVARAQTPGPIAGAQLTPTRREQGAPTIASPPTRAKPSWWGRLAGLCAKITRRVPGPAWACACIALLSATSWSVVSPPLEVIDEPSHFAYTQVLAETHGLPNKAQTARLSLEESVALRDLNQLTVHFNQAIGTISTAAQQRRLRYDLALPYSRSGEGAGVAGTEPPLYYALQTIPYLLGSSGTLLDQLELMRLLSALCGAIAAIFIFLFLREALPAVPWAWTVGGLCASLTPLLGFISGAVNPDAMLCAVSAALFYCLARAFARGLTPRRAVAIGVVIATGFLTKLNFIGLAPGVLLALSLLTLRARRASRRKAYRCLALALGIGLSPVCVYILVNVASHHAALGIVSRNIADTGPYHRSLPSELSYMWQSYLPRLPGMTNYFPGVSTIRQLWFDRLVGLYGWLDTHFPGWVYNVALIPSGLLAAFCARELVRERSALRARAGELIAYASIAAGLLVLIGVDSYLAYPAQAGAYSEPRYMLPLTAIFAAALTLATRGVGRRWGPAAGTLLVVLFLGYDILSQLQVIARYYA